MKARGRTQEEQQRKSAWLPPVRAHKPAQRIYSTPRVRVHNGIIVAKITHHGGPFRWRAYLDYDRVLKVVPEWADDLIDLEIELQGSCKTMDQAIAKSDAASAKVLVKFQKALGREADRELKSLDAQKAYVTKVVRKYGATAAELREFDAVVNGQSLYALDKAALEQLIVSVDWHLSHRGEVKR